jgi:hypothetical protein
MATKSKTFKSTHDGTIVVAVPGREPITFESGGTHETSEQAVIAALSANPDLEQVKKGK